MQQEKLTLQNLPLLENGIVSTAFDAELKRLVKDCEDRPLDDKPRCEDRPLDDKPREISLKVKLTPKVDTHGRSSCCDEVEVECEITGKVPVQRSKVYTMKPKHDGSIVFHPDLPEEPIGPDGKAQNIADPSWHHEQLATPADLKAFIESIKVESGAIFYDEQKIVCVYDRNDRRNVANCKLNLSPQYLWLRDNSQNAMNQQTFVRTLRIMFRNCNESNLLGLVRNLKFSSAGEAAGAIQQGRESISRHVINEVRGEAAIPEEITLAIPVYENHPFTGQVICAVEVLSAEQMFRLTPLPMSLRLCVDDALADIRDMMDGEGLPPMFKGSPS